MSDKSNTEKKTVTHVRSSTKKLKMDFLCESIETWRVEFWGYKKENPTSTRICIYYQESISIPGQSRMKRLINCFRNGLLGVTIENCAHLLIGLILQRVTS